MLFARLILLVQMLVLAGLGLAYWVRPYEMANFNGILLMETDAVSLVRVYYGGLQLGLAVFLLWAMRNRESAKAGLVLVLVTQIALVVARFSSVTLDESPMLPLDWWATLYKVGITVLALIAYMILQRPQPVLPVADEVLLEDRNQPTPIARRHPDEPAPQATRIE